MNDMSDLDSIVILYPKAITLIIVIAAVLLWIVYYCFRIRAKEKIIGSYHASYIAYSLCIISWIGCNFYFHTGLLPYLGTDSGIFMAKLANLASFFAFAFAYYLSCQLAADKKKSKVPLWQKATFILSSIYSIYINIQPGLTVENIEIEGPSQFVLVFGPHTFYFFIILVLFVLLTLLNLMVMRTNIGRIAQAKNNYMIAGILIFMISTVIIHLGVTYFFGDFSLTWLPPVLSISETLLFGYALLTTRFYSFKYIMYTATSALLVSGIFAVFLSYAFAPLVNKDALFLIPAIAFIGTTWQVLYKRISRYVSLLIYGNKNTLVQQILALEEDFKLSIDDAMVRLSNLLNIPNDELRLVTSDDADSSYKGFLSSNDSILLFDELSEVTNNPRNLKSSVKALCDEMSSNNIALVMPLSDQCQSITHLLISSHKINKQLFSSEEISALKILLSRIQSSIEADQKINQNRVLAHSIAHEMRNPLAQVQLKLEALKQRIYKNGPIEQTQLDIEDSLQAILRGRQLIDLILREVNSSVTEHDSTTFTSIHTAVKHAVDQYGFENSVLMERVRLPEHTDFVIKVNETLFNFVIFNLIRNAVYYFEEYPNSRIEISTHTELYGNVLVFRDTGPGIDESVSNKIFDDFFSYQKSGGSGLGLGYCQRVMRSFGGKIECRSKLGEFTEFHLYFPIVPNAPTLDAFDVPDLANNPKGQLNPEQSHETNIDINNDAPTVLIVDDQKVQRSLAQMYLNQLGVNSIQASNGKNAIEVFKTTQVDLVLMDIQMPVMNGFDASQKIKQLSPKTPIIALSGETGDIELEKIHNLMDGRLDKPTTLPALKHVLADRFEAVT